MSPAQQVTDGLLRGRDEGLPFEFAWSVAYDEIVWPSDPVERAEWRTALTWAKDEFEDAFSHPGLPPAYLQRVLSRELENGLSGAALQQLAAAA